MESPLDAITDAVQKAQPALGRVAYDQAPDTCSVRGMRIYSCPGTGGLARSQGFEHKLLATHGLTVGYKCPHACTYCSSPSMYRHRAVFKELGESAFGRGFAIIDTGVPERLDLPELARLRPDDVVQVCTTGDAWAPGIGDVGRRALEYLLLGSETQIRVLTKNARVVDDLDLAEEFPERVTVGLSLTATPAKDDIIRVIEPHASSISERVAALREAKARGLRVYGMVCPLLPGIGDDRQSVSELMQLCLELGAEAIWAEPVNARGRGLIWTAQDLAEAGYGREAQAVDAIRRQAQWSTYARNLVETLVSVAEELELVDRLHVLLYPKPLGKSDREALQALQRGVIWL